MKRSTTVALSGTTLGLVLSSNALSGAVLPAQIQQAMRQTDRNVIVILRDQVASVPPLRRAMGARAETLAISQSSVMSMLPRIAGRKFHAFSTVNAFATSVSASELAQLAADPRVQAVVPDAVIRPLARKRLSAEGPSGSAASTSVTDGGLCNTLEPESLQVTNTAFSDPSIPQAQRVRDGNGQFVTGKGVKVAYIADGLDPNNPAFIRPDGSHVFIDYQDFTGDPAGTPTDGVEAFGDAGTIAAQDMPNGKPLLYDISKFVNSVHPLPSPCNIRVRGMAPGASLVGLDVFGTINPTTTSNFVQAIEYAVIHDDVDVLNESFGGNPFPDNTNDPISLANDAAVRAGVTVVVSTGDAGTAGTLGSPATSSTAIAAGASTTFRLYAQTGDGLIPLNNGGFLDNNISSLSSGGFAQTKARTVDVVAPGDLGWSVCSTNTTLFFGCTNDQKPANPTPISAFGGTSESSPTTAGAAALVIQAYRSTHGGDDPSPATVKRIIMSTATDLNVPSFEQGSGLLNTLAAVNEALSIDDKNGHPNNRGAGLLVAPSSAHATAMPNREQSRTFTVTNEGTEPQKLTPTFETLGAPLAGDTLNLTLDPATDPFFLNVAGNKRAYIKHGFKVPAGMEHLDAAIAFQSPIGSPNPPLVFFGLLDPSGRQVAFSIPQGLGSGYGHVDVANPKAGNWTVIVYTRVSGVAGSYSGPIQFVWATENFEKLGSVSPAHVNLAPGASVELTAEFSMPSSPGDTAAALRFVRSPDPRGRKFAEVPVTLRTLIPTGPTGGNFTGTLTGGNSRASAGPTQTFEFQVPSGVNDVSLVLNIADNGYLLEGLLVDPNGMQLSVQPNQDPLDGSPQFALQLAHYNPQPGRWKFVLLQNFISSGNQTTLPFTARIGFNSARVTAAGLPNAASVVLSAAAAPVVVPISVTNNGALTRLYFADARRDAQTFIELPAQPGACSGPVVTLPGYCGLSSLPTQVSIAAFVAQSSVPITMDAFNSVGTGVGGTGNPDIFASKIGNDAAVALISEPEVPYSTWVTVPSEIGPYGPAGAPTVAASSSAFVMMKPFDSTVSADSGDLWADTVLGTQTFNPLILRPGETGTINVTITPDATSVGKTVNGFIYIDTFNPVVNTGDEVVSLPYAYTISQ
ncbi:MAG: S8 family serine peptidase [Steroidobacteraceae bacterium]